MLMFDHDLASGNETTVTPAPTLADFEAWVDAHAPALVSYARRTMRDQRLAEDAVQETFLAAWRGRAPFEGRSAVRTWLFGILRRKIVDAIRKESRRETHEDRDQTIDDLFDDEDHYRAAILPWSGSPDRDYERREFWQSFKACLERLPERLARTFSLREVEGLESAEICRILGISNSNYWVMLHRARMQLRDCLQDRWYGPRPETVG